MSTVKNLRQHERVLELSYPDGSSISLPYIWFRDNADNARHTNGQKLIDTLKIPLASQPESVELRDNSVTIRWQDGEETHTDLGLIHQTEKASARYWQASDITSLPTFPFEAISTNDSDLKEMLEAVEQLGFALIQGVPTESGALFNVVDLFGFVRETNYGKHFDVKIETNPSNLAFTGLSLGGHTDNPYRNPVPTLQLLHCLENSAEGGDSTLVDGFKVAEVLRQEAPDMFDVLATSPVKFRFQSDDADLENTTTIIQTNVKGELTGISFNNRSMQALSLAAEAMLLFYEAYHRFGDMLEDDTFKLTFKLAPGDLMLFDNTRVLHGRIGYTGAGSRHLQGCYADKDSLLSKLAVLRRTSL